MTEPVKLVSAKTDMQMAAEIRNQLEAPLAACCKIMTEARENGLTVSFNISPDQHGRFMAGTSIVKAL